MGYGARGTSEQRRVARIPTIAARQVWRFERDSSPSSPRPARLRTTRNDNKKGLNGPAEAGPFQDLYAGFLAAAFGDAFFIGFRAWSGGISLPVGST